ncbi:MAG TPA: two-component regulator propeller domain-containing protein, partial [Pyrinomonadaceae bacterium]|nr:two-component regulator propeller domain-containing protein [Pyrinomonadaceae bacterium]
MNIRIPERIVSAIDRLILVFCLLSLIGVCFVQDNYPSSDKPVKQSVQKILFNQIPTELGLSQNVITCSLQDKTGFLWFGTKDGLNRFDGYQFKVYRQVPNDQTSLSDSSITTLFEDHLGRMWVGTENGLNLFDRAKESFYHLLPDPDNPNSISHQQIRSVAEDQQGAIWIGTSGGLNKLEWRLADQFEKPLESVRFTHFKHDPDNPDSFDEDNVTQVLADESGVIWAKTGSSKVYQLTADAAHNSYLVKQFRLDGQKNADLFLEFCPGRNGKIWLADHKGIFEWNTATRQAVFHPFDSVLTGAKISIVTQMIEDRDGNIWFASYWGLARLNPRSEKFDFFPSSHPGIEINPLLEYGINSILEDRRGSFWFGSNGKGLSRYDRQAERFAHSNEQNSKIPLWHGTSVRTLVEIDDDTVIVSSAAGYLLRVNRTTGETASFKIPVNGVLQDAGADALMQDRTGALWLGGGGWLLKIAQQGGEIRKSVTYTLEPDTVGFPYGNSVYKVFEDRAGDIWAVTNAKIFRLNRETDSFTGFRYDTRSYSQMPYDNYVDVYEDRQGIFWIGTTDGLVRFDRKNETFKRFRNDPQDPDSLSHNVVRTIAPDPFEPNILWLGTKGGGLNRFDTAAETFSVLTENDGLPNNVVYGILSDEEGNLWMSTNNGISRFNLRTRTFRNFDKKDGLQDNEFNSCAFFKSRNGELFFGGINGFNAFHPADVKDNPNPPPVVLTGFQILNQPVSFKTPDSPLKQAITETKEITLSYEQRFFSFDFAALDFTEPSKNQYAYQLEGFDKDLVQIGTRRTAFYTNVPPGSYVFRVIAANNDGVWNNQGARIRITVLPPFWQTWWFLTLVSILIIGLIFLLYYRRLAQLEQEKAMQEAFSRQLIEVQENDRKRIAAELHDGLGQSLLIIKNRAFLGEKATEKKGANAGKIESAREQF